MAYALPALTGETTSTDGTGTLTLSGTRLTGHRTLSEAKGDGDLADGDTIFYMTVDDSSDPPDLEVSKGVWDETTGTLTRAVVYQSTNAGSKISWPSGGARDVFVLTLLDVIALVGDGDATDLSTVRGNLDVPGLSEQNSWSVERQTVRVDDRTGNVAGWAVANSADSHELNRSAFEWRAKNGSEMEIAIAQLQSRLITLTAGAEDARTLLHMRVGGSLIATHQLDSDGSVTNLRTGNKFDELPSGTEMLFGTAPPTGWTRVNETDGRVVKLAGSGDTAGGTSGSTDPFGGSWSTQTHALVEAELAVHDHQAYETTSVVDNNLDGTTATVSRHQNVPIGTFHNTATSGSGSGHSHNMQTPQYRVIVRATKD